MTDYGPPDQAAVRLLFGEYDGKGKPRKGWKDGGVLPSWRETWARIRCPECGWKMMRSTCNVLAYSMHYADFHLGIAPFRGWRPLGEVK